MSEKYLLTLSCVDRPGIVAAVANTLAKFGGNIIDAKQFDDLETARFFMRVAFQFIGGDRLEELAPCSRAWPGTTP